MCDLQLYSGETHSKMSFSEMVALTKEISEILNVRDQRWKVLPTHAAAKTMTQIWLFIAKDELLILSERSLTLTDFC